MLMLNQKMLNISCLYWTKYLSRFDYRVQKDYERESKNDKSDAWKQEYDPKNLKDLNYQPAKLETKPMSDVKSGLDHPTQLKQLNLNEMSKLSWIDLRRKNFNSLIKDVVDNLENKDYKTTADTNPYNFKKAKKLLLEIGTKKK